MRKNGKNIRCRSCKKDFYIPGCRFGFKWYCSRECAKKDNYGFQSKEKKCKICGAAFSIHSGLKVQKQTCSAECSKKNALSISYARAHKKTTKTCKKCGTEYIALQFYTGGSKCKKCIYEEYSKNRKGSKNPNFRNGIYTYSNFQNRKSRVAFKHLNECRRYKKEFIARHGYQFCEVCGVNKNGTSRFEVHHIYFASLYPRHPKLHDNLNLIHICVECHQRFHSTEYRNVFARLEKERGLKKLFTR